MQGFKAGPEDNPSAEPYNPTIPILCSPTMLNIDGSVHYAPRFGKHEKQFRALQQAPDCRLTRVMVKTPYIQPSSPVVRILFLIP